MFSCHINPALRLGAMLCVVAKHPSRSLCSTGGLEPWNPTDCPTIKLLYIKIYIILYVIWYQRNNAHYNTVSIFHHKIWWTKDSTTDNSTMHENKSERVCCQMSPAPLDRVDQQQVNRAVQSLVQCRTKPITLWHHLFSKPNVSTKIVQKFSLGP